MSYSSQTARTTLGSLTVVYVILSLISMFCWHYTFSFWGVHVAHKELDHLWVASFVIGFVPWVGRFGIPAALITLVVSLLGLFS